MAKNRTRPDLRIGEIYEYDIDDTAEQLDIYCAKADFVFNQAGVNRPKDPEEFQAGNYGFVGHLLETLRKHHNKCPLMLSSSVQATLAGRFGLRNMVSVSATGRNFSSGMQKRQAPRCMFIVSRKEGVNNLSGD